jgi:endonuclease YncB( thermonuclease family)
MPIAPLLLVCTVLAVSDGDTLKARCATAAGTPALRIRIAGIDAPERGQPFSQAARRALAARARGKSIAADCYKVDRYGRHVCRVGRGDTDLGLAQVRDGMAWRYAAFGDEQEASERAAYADGEAAARAARRGLWQEPSPVPPWLWRKARP